MIVVPSYNGYSHLDRLIKSLEKYGTSGHKVVIVDNHTTDLVSKIYLRDLLNYSGNLQIEIIRPVAPNYEAGALVHAVEAFPEEEKAILLHDSCEILESNWLDDFENLLTPETGAVTWVRFRPCLWYMFSYHLEYIDQVLGNHDNPPSGGFFGGIFYTYTSIIKEFNSNGFFKLLPTQKIHSEAWERIWAMLYHNHNYQTASLDDSFDPMRIHHGTNFKLRKIFAGR